MDDFLAGLASQFDDKSIGGVADALGISQEIAGSAFAVAAPAVMSALSGKASTPDGAAGLMRTFSTLTSMGSSHPATMLSGLLNDTNAMNAGLNMARSLFGSNIGAVAETLSARAGVSGDVAQKVLGMATPAIMGAVGTQVKNTGLDAASLGAFLNDEANAISEEPPMKIGVAIPSPVLAAAPAVAAVAAQSAGVASTVPAAPAASEAQKAPSATTSAAALTDLGIDDATAVALAMKLGLPEVTVQRLAPVVVGLVLTALGRKSKQPDGMKQIGVLIDSAGQAGLNSMSAAEYVKQTDTAHNADILGSVIGENTLENVSDNFGRKLGITSEQAAGLLGYGVPVVLGQLGRTQTRLETDTQGLVAQINEKAAHLQNAGEIGYILENVPGISDNVKRGLKRLFGRA